MSVCVSVFCPKVSGDELLMLRKLISEGRISGINEKPPTVIPPFLPRFQITTPTSEIKFISINDDQSIPSKRSAKRELRSEGVHVTPRGNICI